MQRGHTVPPGVQGEIKANEKALSCAGVASDSRFHRPGWWHRAADLPWARLHNKDNTPPL